jgi:N-acyl-D-aspartate/D-glutamate deacylase
VLDTLIKAGVVVDGTDAPGQTADIGLRDCRIVGIGRVAEGAKRTIDADGRVVAPGFIDIHTHYDAQVIWDPWVMPSPQQGVTTVLGAIAGSRCHPATIGTSRG